MQLNYNRLYDPTCEILAVANVIFLESPVGVGFSYSNETLDFKLSGDKRTADEAFVFLLNWLKRFPEYKGRPFYISGESYGGHYVPQLAATILGHNLKNSSTGTSINLRGILVRVLNRLLIIVTPSVHYCQAF